MPSKERVAEFVAMVESGMHAEAIETFYHPDATMQENLKAPRVGRDVLVAHERKVLAGAREVRSRLVGPVLIESDRVVINWVFEFVYLDGRLSALDEIAVQSWQGDRIIRERFYYDPAQLRA